MTIPEYKTTGVTKEKFILSHYGLAKSCWDWLILIVTFYVAIVVPYNAAFKDKLQASTGDCDHMDMGDVIVEVVFVIGEFLFLASSHSVINYPWFFGRLFSGRSYA